MRLRLCLLVNNVTVIFITVILFAIFNYHISDVLFSIVFLFNSIFILVGNEFTWRNVWKRSYFFRKQSVTDDGACNFCNAYATAMLMQGIKILA